MKNLKKTLSLLIDFERPIPTNCLLCENPYGFNPRYGCKKCNLTFISCLDFPGISYKKVSFLYGRKSNAIVVFIGEISIKNKMYGFDGSYLRKADLLKAEGISLL